MSNENRDFLDEHFAAAQPEAVVEPVQAVETPPEPVEQQETVEEVQTPPEQAPEVTTTPEIKESGTVPYAAMKAEREKRQKLEKELGDLRKQAPQEPVPSYYEDPEGYLQRIQNETNQRLYAALEASAREQYPDYDDAFAVVMRHAASNPAVASEVMTAANPAVAAYKMGKRLAEFEQMQDPEAYRAKIEADLRAKWDAEQAAKAAQRQKTAAEIPPDLSQARNTRGEYAANPTVFQSLFER